ncbi:MAG: hypothetical protein CMC50_00205 [Flavobacteriaceae bacterium]|nr:hypothetical protein [Flavobacteriaceae bacterium]
MKKIYFVEKSIPFNSNDINKSFVGGSEKTLINISNVLGKSKNLTIKVFNKTNINKKIDNVQWNNINNISPSDQPDVLICMSDANLLDLFRCKKNFLWSHSVQPIEKFIRKKQFFPFIKHKPIIILEGEYHYRNRSFFTSMFGKKILPIAVDDEFINFKVNEHFIPKKKAIFTTRSDRNLDFLLNSWSSIAVKSPNSSLYINPPYDLTNEQLKLGVKLRIKGDKLKLIDELSSIRVMLNPGHAGEVFCLAAEEARELCIPIVTMGIGSLSERVEHKITGYIAKNKDEFINYTIKILNDDNCYLNLKKNLMKRRNIRSYKDVATDLLKIINND